MQEGLQEILDLTGVETGVVVDNRGSPFIRMGSMRFTEEQLQEIGAIILHSLASLESAGAAGDDLEFFFEEYHILVRDLDQAILYVICQPSVNVSLLRMTSNVVINRWKDAPEAKRILKKHAVRRKKGKNLLAGAEAKRAD